jgi:hypothetical protein
MQSIALTFTVFFPKSVWGLLRLADDKNRIKNSGIAPIPWVYVCQPSSVRTKL